MTTLQTVEEAEEILKNIEVIRHLIDKEPAQAKCEICEQKKSTHTGIANIAFQKATSPASGRHAILNTDKERLLNDSNGGGHQRDLLRVMILPPAWVGAT